MPTTKATARKRHANAVKAARTKPRRSSVPSRRAKMQHRPFGRTGWQVSEIGIGTWAMGGWWGPLDDRRSLAALRLALELGVNFIDTALVYGDGHGERLIAKVLKGRASRKPVYVATKIPPKNLEWPARATTPLVAAFPASWIVRCTEQSLRNLRVDCIDLQQFHVWTDRWLADSEWYETVQRLKQQGKIRQFGVSINDHEPGSALELVRSGLVDAVQVIYNIFDQAPAEQLLPLCRAKKVGVIVRVPLDEGGLTGTLTPATAFHVDDWRNRYFRGDRLRETAERAGRLQFLIRDEITSLAQAALKFSLSHPAVSTVIAGMRRPEHVQANCAASDGRLLTRRE